MNKEALQLYLYSNHRRLLNFAQNHRKVCRSDATEHEDFPLIKAELALDAHDIHHYIDARHEMHRGSDTFYINDIDKLIYVYSGDAIVDFESRSVSLTAGNMMVVSSFTAHRIHIDSPKSIVINVFFREIRFKKLLKKHQKCHSEKVEMYAEKIFHQYHSEGFLFFKSIRSDHTALLVENILGQIYKPWQCSRQMAQHYVELFLLAVLREKKAIFDNQKVMDSVITNRLVIYLENEYRNPSLTKMATHFNYNPNYFSTLIKEKFGRSFTELITIQRMTVAAVMLNNPLNSVDDIIEQIGYSSESYFYKQFKNYFGTTPRQMRENLKIEQ